MFKQANHFSRKRDDDQIGLSSFVEGNHCIETTSKLARQFNQTALKYSKKIAISDDQNSLTYRQLYDGANQLAQFLLSQRIPKGTRIGILAKRSPALALAILGIIKIGGAYVPYDPEYPLERIATMLALSEVKVLLIDASSALLLKELLKDKSVLKKIIFLDSFSRYFFRQERLWDVYDVSEWQKASKENPQIESADEDSLVILFTSGSTGKPKGVELTHRGYINNFESMQRLIKLNENSKIAQMASPCFDISVTELWMPLLFGASVCIVPNHMKKNPWALAEWINHYQIDTMQFVPSLFQAFLLALQEEDITFPSIKKLLFIGEPLRSQLVSKWYRLFGSSECKIYNLYGPVETSIEVSAFVVDKHSSLNWEYVPIGKPFKNMRFHLQNDSKQNSQKGMLFLDGIQLAKGYLDSDQTDRAFQNGLYRSGDLVERMPSGDFMFLMREDRQVKIRGYRVELREIEVVLNNHIEISHAAVKAAKMTEDVKIQAFVVSTSLTVKRILEFLKRKLPHYMIPHEIFILDEIPLNPNGKVDYNALHSTSK